MTVFSEQYDFTITLLLLEDRDRFAPTLSQNRTCTIASHESRKGHRVPLSNAAVAVLQTMRGLSDDFVFPGHRKDKPLSNMAMLVLLRCMNRGDLTVHGFRSTFKDWAAERTAAAREVAEMALAHAISDKVDAAYQRGDLFEKRRLLMEAWAGHCDKAAPGPDKIVTLKRRAS
jgi:integrase